LVTDRSIYCHMTLSAMNYLLFITNACVSQSSKFLYMTFLNNWSLSTCHFSLLHNVVSSIPHRYRIEVINLRGIVDWQVMSLLFFAVSTRWCRLRPTDQFMVTGTDGIGMYKSNKLYKLSQRSLQWHLL
jgi:hypothetical protein